MKAPDFEKRWCGHRSKCWVWLKYTNEKGYAYTSRAGKKRRAHRVYYEEHFGVVLEPHEQLDHLCENESCVNPLHMEIVDNTENQKRRARLTRQEHEEIIALKGVLSQERIAEQFGYSRRYIRDIHAGKVAEWQ